MVLSVFAFLAELAAVEVRVSGGLSMNHGIGYNLGGGCKDFRKVYHCDGVGVADCCLDLVHVLGQPYSNYHKAMVLSVLVAISGRQSFQMRALDGREGLHEQCVA